MSSAGQRAHKPSACVLDSSSARSKQFMVGSVRQIYGLNKRVFLWDSGAGFFMNFPAHITAGRCPFKLKSTLPYQSIGKTNHVYLSDSYPFSLCHWPLLTGYTPAFPAPDDKEVKLT